MALAHPGLLQAHDEPTFVQRAPPPALRKVILVFGGGSGSDAGRRPWGNIGSGVLFIVKHPASDAMNLQIASELLELENASRLVNDDVTVEKSTPITGRRGAGLAECKTLGDRANKATAPMGVAFSSCIVQAAGVRLCRVPTSSSTHLALCRAASSDASWINALRATRAFSVAPCLTTARRL